MTTLTGKQFHQANPGQKFYKFIGGNRNGYQYREGLNVLRPGETFNPSGSCESGGLYFTDRDNSLSWIPGYDKFAEMQVPDDAQVYKEPCGTKYKASALVLGKIKPIEEFWTPEMINYAIETNKKLIQFIPSKCITESIAKKSLEHASYNIQYIPEEYQTQEAWNKACDEYSWINFEKCPDKFLSQELCEKFFKKNPWSFQCIPEKMCREVAMKCLYFVPDKYMTPGFLKDIIKDNPVLIISVPDRFLTQELVDVACGLDRSLTRYIPLKFQRYPYFNARVNENLRSTHPFTRPVIPFTGYRGNTVPHGPTYYPFQSPVGVLGGPYIQRPPVYRYGFY